MEDLHGKIPMILDGGAVMVGVESTIIDFTENSSSDPKTRMDHKGSPWKNFLGVKY